MKQKVAHNVVACLLDDSTKPHTEEEARMLENMRSKSTKENLADTLLLLGQRGLRLWVESLVETAQEHPAVTRAAAESLLSNLEPIISLAGTMLKGVQ